MKKIYSLILMLSFFAVTQAQLTGTKNIPGDYADLAAAITDLNAQGVGAGGVTLNVTAAQTAPLGGYVIGGTGSFILSGAAANSAANPVIITGNLNTATAFATQTAGNINDAIFKLIGADYVTIQGFTMQEAAANTTTAIATNNMTEFGVALFYVTATDGAQNNTIQNNAISLNRAYSNTFGIYSNTRVTSAAPLVAADATSAAGSNSNNKVYGNAISNVDKGISFIGANTAVAMDNGNDIGGTSAVTGNTITNWGGLVSGVMSVYISTNSTSCIFMNDQVGDNVSFNTMVSATNITTLPTTGIAGIIKAYSFQPTGLTFTSNYNSNTVTITNAATTAQLTGMGLQGLTTLATATFNCNNNSIINCAQTGAGVLAASIIGMLHASAPGIFNVNGNTIRGFSTNTTTTGGFIGIQMQTNAVVNTLNINNNKIGDATAGALTFNNTNTTAAVTGIVVLSTGAAATCALSITGNDLRGIAYATSGTGAHLYISNAGVCLSQNISNNTFTNLNVNTTGNVTFIANSVSAPAAGFKTINNNSIVGTFNKGGAGGTVALYTDGASSVCTTPVQNMNNNFSNITVTGAAIITGWFNNDGTGSTPAKTITSNTFTNWTGGTGAITVLQANFGGNTNMSNNTISTITSQGAITGINQGSSGTIANLTIANNQLTNITSTGTGGVVIGLNSATSAILANITGNKVNTLSSTGASTTVHGIVTSGAGASSITTLSKDTVINLSAAGITSPTIRGIQVAGGVTVNVDSCQVNTFSASGAGSVIMQGINVATATASNTTRNNVNGLLNSATGVNSQTFGYNLSGGSGINLVSNNFITNLTASSSALSNAVVGIFHNTTVATLKAYYNTVYLGVASALTGGANFGATGVLFPLSASTLLDLKSNIININATASGTGIVAAVRRSSASAVANTAPVAANFDANNNIYSVNSGVQNYLYVDGTDNTNTKNGYAVSGLTASVPNNIVNDANFNTSCGLYKVFMGVREGATYNENNLIAAAFPATFIPFGVSYAESNGGATVPATTNDYASVARTMADAGALQFSGTANDAAGPTITFTALTNTVCTSAPTVAAVITDPSGVNTAPGLAPRLYYRKGAAAVEADAFLNYPAENTSAFNGWKYVEATGTAPNFSFAIDYNLLQTPMAVGDSLTYFVVAQDNAAIPNVGKNAVTFPTTFCPTSVVIPATGAVPTSASLGFKIIPYLPTYTNSTAGNYTQGAVDARKMYINVTGFSACIDNVTAVTFNTGTSTAPAADITQAKCYYTTTTTFATTMPFGSAIATPSGGITFTGSQALAAGTGNYFWLVYDLNCAATVLDSINATATNIVIGSNTFVPTGTGYSRHAVSTLYAPTYINTTAGNYQQGTLNASKVYINISGSTACNNPVNSITFNTGTSTAPALDIAQAKCYYTTSTTFNTTTPYGTPILTPSGVMTFTGSQALANGSGNYFWLVYDVNCTAVVLDSINATVTNMVVGSTTFIPTGTGYSRHAVSAPVVGDAITTAPVLILGDSTLNTFNISGKTLDAGEPSPILNAQGGSQSGSSNYSWGTAAGGTQWFKLVVPASGYGSSGNFLIGSTTTTGSPSTDAQIALWEFPSMPSGCGSFPNFSNAKLLQANDDKILGSGFNPQIRARLTPGNTYYVQVDGYLTDLPIGNVYAKDLAQFPYSLANNGLGNYHNPTGIDMRFGAYEVNSTDGWTYYYGNGTLVTDDVAGISDDQVLMAVNWGTGYLYNGTYSPGTIMANHLRRSASTLTLPSTGNALISTDSIVVWSGRNNASAASNDLALTDGGYVLSPKWWMMNKFWNLIPKTQPSAAVGVRTFYSDADFTALQTTVVAGGGTLAAHADMKFIKATKGAGAHFSNAEVDPGAGHAALTAGTVTNLTWANFDAVQVGINQAEFTISTFSGGGGGSTGLPNSPLPSADILSGRKQGSSNLLDWKVSCTTSPSVDITLERSADNRSFAPIQTQNATAARCDQNFTYVDASPLAGINYYRVKLVTDQGRVRYTSIVALLSATKGFELISLAPNPVRDMATLSISSAKAGKLEMSVIDFSGKMLSKESVTVIAGNNPITMNFATLAAGTYTITARNADGELKTTRFVKY